MTEIGNTYEILVENIERK